jgi:hypothetical protein
MLDAGLAQQSTVVDAQRAGDALADAQQAIIQQRTIDGSEPGSQFSVRLFKGGQTGVQWAA